MLLDNPVFLISEIASMLGFYDAYAFSHFFKFFTEMSPLQCRKEDKCYHLKTKVYYTKPFLWNKKQESGCNEHMLQLGSSFCFQEKT